MRLIIGTILLAGLGACSSAPENDKVFQALKANPPTEIPARHLPKLRRGTVSCDVYEKGKASQYMTCWWPGGKPTYGAYLTYYGSGLRRPEPRNIIAPGGNPITEYIIFP